MTNFATKFRHFMWSIEEKLDRTESGPGLDIKSEGQMCPTLGQSSIDIVCTLISVNMWDFETNHFAECDQKCKARA